MAPIGSSTSARRLRSDVFVCRNVQLRTVERAVTRRTRLFWIESPTNPLLRIADIRAAAKIAHRHGALCLVDNTFASPYFQRPLNLGADLVLHSTTKYIGGHADVVGGAICLNDRALYQRLKYLRRAGATPSPFDCFRTLRGIKTWPAPGEHEKTQLDAAFLKSAALRAYSRLSDPPARRCRLQWMALAGWCLELEGRPGAACFLIAFGSSNRREPRRVESLV